MAKVKATLVIFSVASFLVGNVVASSVRGFAMKEIRKEKEKRKPPLAARPSWDFETGTSCSKLNCSFAIDASEAATFRGLIDEKKALAIFMLVTIGNMTESMNDDSMNVSFTLVPLIRKWAWLRNERGRFLATLPYDFDILSLTTLKRDAFNVNVTITSTPRDCFANLSKNCLFGLISETLADGLTGPRGNVCVRTEESSERSTLKYRGYLCCERRNNSVFICDKEIKDNQWVDVAIRLLWALSIGFGLFAPLLFKYLPRGFKRGPKVRPRTVVRRESEMSESGTSVLDMIAVNSRQVLLALDGGMVDILRAQTESVIVSRLCRCLFVVLLSSLPLLQGFIYAYLKGEEVGITRGTLLGVGDAFITLMEKDGRFALSVAYCFCIALICIAIAIPRTLPDFARRLSGRKDERTFLGFSKPEELVSTSDQRGFQLMYDNMVFHLNCLLKLKFWKFLFLVITYPLQKLCGLDAFNEDADPGARADLSVNEGRYKELCSKICRGVLLVLSFPLWVVTITTAFLLYMFPVTYVAFRIWKMLFRIEVESPCCQNIPSLIRMTSIPILYIMFIIFCICVEASYLMLAVALTFNIMFLGAVTGFTIMGLLFNIDFYLPYIVFGALVVIYIFRGINKYYAQFTKLKATVFEECENYDNTTKVETNIRDTFKGPTSADRRSPSTSSLSRSKSINFLVTVDEYGVPSIPLDIFIASSHQLMPFKRIFLAKLLKVIALGSYLVVIFLFVMSLSEYKAASTIAQAFALLLLGGLPLCAFQSSDQISQAEEIKARFYVKDFIKQYTKRAF